MFERWHMINISYHIIDLRDRDDLIELLLGNMDFTLYVPSSMALCDANRVVGIVTCVLCFLKRLLQAIRYGSLCYVAARS